MIKTVLRAARSFGKWMERCNFWCHIAKKSKRRRGRWEKGCASKCTCIMVVHYFTICLTHVYRFLRIVKFYSFIIRVSTLWNNVGKIKLIKIIKFIFAGSSMSEIFNDHNEHLWSRYDVALSCSTYGQKFILILF